VANCGGIAVGDSDSADEKELYQPEAHWNLAEYLPPLAANFFIALISEFVFLPFKHEQELRLQHPSQAESQAAAYQTPEERRDRFAQYLSGLVNTALSRKVFKMVKDLQQQLSGDEKAGDMASDVFPILPGSHLPLHNPALEFVKAVCHVMALDAVVEDEVVKLRTNLMKIVDVKTFSSKAQFVNPCLTFVLPDVICMFCNHCRDLDLCRDPELKASDWRCSLCKQPYDRFLIEKQLVDIVNRRSVAYQVQDLRCSKCGKVQTDNMSPHCACTGRYECVQTGAEFDKRMQAFASIAEHHKFDWLKEAVAWIRGTGP